MADAEGILEARDVKEMPPEETDMTKGPTKGWGKLDWVAGHAACFNGFNQRAQQWSLQRTVSCLARADTFYVRQLVLVKALFF